MIIRAYTVLPASSSPVLHQPWFIVLVIAGAVERLSGVALGVAVERDWVVLVVTVNSLFLFIILTGLEQVIYCIGKHVVIRCSDLYS